MSVAEIPAHLIPKRYRIKCECLRCGHAYAKEVSEKHYHEIIRGDRQDPPCTRKACKEAALKDEIERKAINMAAIISSQKAPGHVGSILAKACDLTARIVMEDHKLTDMRDDNRVGETSVPKLPSHQQSRVDGFFGAGRAVIPHTPAAAKVAGYATLAHTGALANQPDAQAISSMLANAPKLRHVRTEKAR